MLRSLAVILVPVLLIAAWFTRTPAAPNVPELDARAPLATARAEAPYPVLAPEALLTRDSGWVTTVARWTKVGSPGVNNSPEPRNRWQLGMLSPEKTYFGLVQGDLGAPQLIAETTRDGVADGVSRAGGHEWKRMRSADGRTRSLVSRGDHVTTIVSADADYAALDDFAAQLR